MKPIAYINVEKRTLEFAEPIKWHTPTVANLDRIPLFTKEALAQPEQEPVANIRTWRKNGELHAELWNWDRGIESLPDGEYDLYTTPPQRSESSGKPSAWVGLTDDEIAQGWKESWVTEQAFQSAVWWAEEKLKEKNT